MPSLQGVTNTVKQSRDDRNGTAQSAEINYDALENMDEIVLKQYVLGSLTQSLGAEIEFVVRFKISVVVKRVHRLIC